MTDAVRAWLIRRVCGCATLAVAAASLACSPRPPSGEHDDGRAAAIRAVAALRLFEPRLSNGGPHAPIARARGSSWDEFDLPPAARVAVARLELASSGSIDRRSLGDLALARLLVGDLDDAVSLYEHAVAFGPCDGALLNDLSVAYLARARLGGRPSDPSRALDAATRAIRCAPDLPEARFNLALAFDAAGLPSQAAGAWRSYLESGPADGWASEARDRLRAGTAADPGSAAMPSPQWARERVEEQLLAAWAGAELRGDRRTASESLDEATQLAQAVTWATGDALLERTVLAAAGARGPVRMRLAHGHRAFAQGRGLFVDGQPGAALDSFRESLQHFRRADTPAWLRAAFELARVHFRRRELAAAGGLLGEIAPVLADEGFGVARGRNLWLRGAVRFEQGAFTDAVQDYDDAIALLERAGEAENAAIAHGTAADTWRVLGDAARSWLHMRRALDGLPGIRDATRRYNLLLNASLFARADGQFLASLAYLDAALDTGTSGAPTLVRCEGLIRRASLLLQISDTGGAARDLHAAQALLPSLPDEDDRRYTDAYAAAVEAERLVSEDPAEARRLLERAMRVLRDQEPAEVPNLFLLGGRAWVAAADDAAAEAEFRRGLTNLSARLGRIDSASHRLRFRENSVDLHHELAALSLRAGRPADALSRADGARAGSLRRRAQARREDPPIADEVTRALAEGEALLHYTALGDRVVWFLVTRHSLSHDVVAADVRELGALVGLMTRALRRTHAGPLTAAERLHSLLIAPIAARLRGVTDLVVVPDGPLHRLPFAALVDRRTGRYLLDDFTVALAPSAEWLVTRPTWPRDVATTPGALFVGNPARREADPRFPDLPHSEREVRQVAGWYDAPTILTGPAATPRRVLEAIGRAPVAHFAVHAVANDQFPERACLRLAEDPEHPAHAADLYAGDVDRLALPGTALVVLAGCRTADGALYRGEGILSLARPFLDAGARSVVATLWDVDDFAAAALLTEFHRSFVSTGNVAASLRAAQLALARGDDPRLSAGMAWAGVVAFGGDAGLPRSHR
jgi:CHAT domain-containing protein